MNALEIEGLSKRYRIGKRLSRDLWALDDVSFVVPRGTILGVIGPNGAGKTTLLKVLSRVTRPTAGRVVGQGRVIPLLALGAGFQPEFSGRENVYMNAAMYGLSSSEVDERMDEIVEFAGLANFMDVAVRRYSSGMYLRLAFSVAINMRPDILLADEVLAVGDLEFQERCLERVRQAGEAGMSVLFVSHDMEAIRRLCSQVLWLSGGKVMQIGPAEAVTAAYESAAWTGSLAGPRRRGADSSNDVMEILFARLTIGGREVGAVRVSDEALLTIGIRVKQAPLRVRPLVDVKTQGVVAFRSVAPEFIDVQTPGLLTAQVTLPPHLLADTVYTVDVKVVAPRESEQRVAVTMSEAVAFQVFDTDESNSARGTFAGQIRGIVRPRLEWAIAHGTREQEADAVRDVEDAERTRSERAAAEASKEAAANERREQGDDDDWLDQ